MAVSFARETVGPESLYRITLGEVLVWCYAVLFILVVMVGGAIIAARLQVPPEPPVAPPPVILMDLPPIVPPEPVKKAEEAEKPVEKAAPAEKPQDAAAKAAASAGGSDQAAAKAQDAAGKDQKQAAGSAASAGAQADAAKAAESAAAASPVPQTISPALRQLRQQAAATERNNSGSEVSAALETAKTAEITPDEWQAEMLAKLASSKRYPDGARSRGEKGIVFLKFAVNPKGDVTAAEIAKSSGFPELDQAALDMIARASPLPAPPAVIARAVGITVPVDFGLQ
jgi:protein TonB